MGQVFGFVSLDDGLVPLFNLGPGTGHTRIYYVSVRAVHACKRGGDQFTETVFMERMPRVGVFSKGPGLSKQGEDEPAKPCDQCGCTEVSRIFRPTVGAKLQGGTQRKAVARARGHRMGLCQTTSSFGVLFGPDADGLSSTRWPHA